LNIFDYFALLLLAITIANLLTIKTLKGADTSDSNFNILIPMRNEAANVSGVINSSLNQGGKVIVLNDNSEDSTLENLQSFLPQIEILSGLELPQGWLGKNFACHQLAVHSHSEYLVFIDADVRLVKGAVQAAINHMEKRGWDYISPYPRQRTSGFLQLLIQPLLQWSWFASIPFIYAYRFPKKSMAVANGQFLIIKRDAYQKAGGHKEIKSEVLDDIELARSLIKSGFKGGPVNGSQIAECQMYKGNKDLIAGYTKSLWRAFGSPIGGLIAIALLLATSVPFFQFSIGMLFILISRALTALKVRSNLFIVILHPIAMLAQSLLIIHSFYLHRIGQLNWRGRKI
jgi:glycosyltransferase involved in cell wall biosynthesis